MKTVSASLRINVLGAKGVGKSAITVRYLTKRFIGEYSSGLDISYQTTYHNGDVPVKVDILDTSSQEDCQASCHDVYDADAFVVVYNVTDPSSFRFAMSEVNIIRARSGHLPVLLLGNKLDLDHARNVMSAEEIEHTLEPLRCHFHEVSAAECHVPIHNSFQLLMVDAVCNVRQRDRSVKRRKSLFENMSRKIGNVFRRKSLEEAPVAKKKMMRISDGGNRRSV